MREVLIEHEKGKRPHMPLTVRRVEPSVWYTLGFYKHHYLTEKLNPSCKCFLFEWCDIPVAFVGILNTPRTGIPYGMSISRIVVLPDYQGLGLSTIICNFCGGIVTALSDDEHQYKLYIKTAHEKMGEALGRDPNWMGTQFDGKPRSKEVTIFEKGRYNNRLMRKSYCKVYVGGKIYGFEDLMRPIGEMRANKEKKKKPKEPKQLLINFIFD